MKHKRSVLDRLLPLVRPTLLTDFAPPPQQVDAHLWVLDRRLRMPGGPILPARTTIVVPPSGGLLVVSPPPVEAGGLEGLDALGPVRHVLVPNSFHYLNARQFLTRYPQAILWAAPGLFSRVPGLPPGNELTEVVPDAWRGVVEHAILGPTRGVSEVAVFHRESATLILTDLAFHMVRLARRFDRIAWWLSGVPSGFGPSRTARMLLLRDRALAAAFLRRLLAWPFRRVLVAHGESLEVDALGVFRRAFAVYLPDAQLFTQLDSRPRGLFNRAYAAGRQLLQSLR